MHEKVKITYDKNFSEKKSISSLSISSVKPIGWWRDVAAPEHRHRVALKPVVFFNIFLF